MLKTYQAQFQVNSVIKPLKCVYKLFFFTWVCGRNDGSVEQTVSEEEVSTQRTDLLHERHTAVHQQPVELNKQKQKSEPINHKPMTEGLLLMGKIKILTQSQNKK